MVESKNSSSQTECIIQDIGTVWENVDEKLKQFYDRVSVVSTNFSLTWIKDKGIETAAQNISNLLSDDGIVVLNIVYDDIFKRLTQEKKTEIEELLKYPTEQGLIGKWLTSLKKVGLNKFHTQYWEPKTLVNEELYIEGLKVYPFYIQKFLQLYRKNFLFTEYVNLAINWYKSCFNINNDSNPDLDQQLKRLLIENSGKKFDLISGNDENQIEVTNYIWQIVAQKSENLD